MDHALDHPVFQAELRPYRSLGPAGLAILVALTFAFGAFNVIFFLVSGAWPIAFFFGLDIALLYGAFWLSYRSGRMREEVALSRSSIHVRKISPAGKIAEWRDNPFYSRFDVARHDEFGITAMRLIGRSSRTEIGSFLNPDDRESFAKAFGQALATVKQRI